MTPDNFSELFTEKVMDGLFPTDRADRFFEAIYGEISEGAYDIRLSYHGRTEDTLEFRFNLHRRPKKCLVCSLTYGLPKVFTRHPIINIQNLVSDIGNMLNGAAACNRWELGQTKEISSDLHVIPLTIYLNSA